MHQREPTVFPTAEAISHPIDICIARIGKNTCASTKSIVPLGLQAVYRGILRSSHNTPREEQGLALLLLAFGIWNRTVAPGLPVETLLANIGSLEPAEIPGKRFRIVFVIPIWLAGAFARCRRLNSPRCMLPPAGPMRLKNWSPNRRRT